MALKEGVTGLEKTQNQLTCKQVPSSGGILNQKFDLFIILIFDFLSSFQEQLRVKRDKLADQLEEAKKLKQNIDKRSFTVLSMLRKYLSDQLLADYDKFIKTKARLIMETRQLNDKVALSEEQKTILKET